MRYYRPISSGDIFYSVDKVRFKFELNLRQARFLFSLVSDMNYEFFESFKSFQYKNLFSIKTFDGLNSFSLGVGYNGSTALDKNHCFIEFNPNKVGLDKNFLKIISFLNLNVFKFDLSLYDIAVDVPYNKKFVSLVKDRRLYKKFVYDCVGSNVTEYLGTSADSGRVKLYNKTIESGLAYDLTRLELTTNCIDYLVVLKQFPQLLVCGDFDLLASTKLCKTDYVLLQLLWQSDSPSFYYKQLGRDKQEKLKPFIVSNFDLGFSEDVFSSLLDIIDFFRTRRNFE